MSTRDPHIIALAHALDMFAEALEGFMSEAPHGPHCIARIHGATCDCLKSEVESLAGDVEEVRATTLLALTKGGY